ncbi:MAG: VWA domain-containing protein [Pseudonocardiaceae bacterium]
MDPRPGFSLTVNQEKYLSTSDSRMDAILRVAAQDWATRSRVTPEAAQVILVDCSGSMSVPPTRIAAARRATAAAIDTLRDGAYFAIVAGTDEAKLKYPSVRQLATANAQTKAEAKAVAAGLVASGGTAMGTWLTLARELLDSHPAAVRHALLLTDGKNREAPRRLEGVLDECAGRFVCDARGIGADWEPKELRRIVEVLRGQVDAVRVNAELAADFRQITEAVMSKVVPDIRIRVRLMPGTRLRYLKQVYPTEQELTAHRSALEVHTMEFSTGSWGSQDSRDYQLCLSLDQEGKAKEEETQVAAVELASVMAGPADTSRRGAPSPITVIWTDDLVRSSRVHPKVAHYTGQAEINRAVTAGCDAYDAGRLAEAGQEWGRAIKLATESGNAEILKRMERLVEIKDAAQGRVTIKPGLAPGDLLKAAVGSNISTRSPDSPAETSDEPGPAGPDRVCPNCQRISAGDVTYCGKCRRPLSAQDELDGGQRR